MTQNTAARTLVYVGHGEDSDIRLLTLDASGALVPVQAVTVPNVAKGGSSMPIAITPDRRFLHVGLRGEPLAVATFAIDPGTGELGHLATTPLVDSMAYIATDRSGRFLLGASFGGNKVSVSPIGADGRVGETIQVLATAPNAHCILPSPDNRFVLVPCRDGNVVMQYRFDAETGRLAANDPPTHAAAPGAGPRHLTFHPNGRLVYLLNELDATVDVLGYDPATGLLSAIESHPARPEGFAGQIWAADIHLTPDARFLYATERGSSTLRGFRVDGATGRLTTIGSFATETQPRSFAIDPDGRFLLAVGQVSNSLSCHAIDQESGALTLVGKTPMGNNPNWVEIIRLG